MFASFAPPPGHRQLFGDLPLQPVSKGSKVLTVQSEQPRADAERLLKAFARRAYRRPVTADDVDPILKLVTEQLDALSTHLALAVRTTEVRQ